MSTDSDTSSRGGGGSFREITRDRLLNEMLRSTRNKGSTWKVLIMDKLTVKIMSSSCKMGDITEQGVSLVEDLYKRRQPLPSMDAIYFMQPIKENIQIFMSDMSGKRPLYKKAYIFFSSPIQKEWVPQIKKDSSVSTRLGGLSEMNLEYFAVDSQGFVTDHDKALEELFTENEEGSMNYNSCINTMATRIATVFASMREFPRVHYRVARTIDASTLTTLQDLVPTKLAASVWNCMARYKSTIPEFPQTETCELLIVDRSIDQIAPIMHEWTYDAMCHDLLGMDGNKYVQEVPNKTGSGTEKKEVLLEDHDPIWLELRDVHVADANLRLHEKMSNFISKNKAAQLHQARAGGELSTKELQKMVRALPQYTDQIDKLSLHVEIAEKLFGIIKQQHLKDVGQLEQDLVFGNAGSKELIDFFRTHQDISRENKLRLLMIYAAINPEKIQSEKGTKLMQLAGLSADDMIAVNNMRCLCAHETKKSSKGGFPLKFEIRKKKRGIRKERVGEESTWMLSRFYPILEDLIEKLSKGELPKDEYHCMSDPSSSFRGISSSLSARTSPAHQPAQSMRSRRTGGTWARPRNSDDGYSSDSVLKHASSDMRKLGRRLFIFVVGGATRSELRAVHKLSSKLQREIILGSSSLDDPANFITKLKMMSTEQLSLDDLQI
ncbi:probable protein transport Sec1a [Hordeum vulgare subsp. vulgare]|uniref:SNARE-interacting protein KEULE n=1 Tax=Hordeum vulgare subsp. vulgare TaxID=112509 RepID=A0A8I6XBX1_HORVV|nr:probable protein transport Sec1a [Hordeum vulgare subsp. vulgare]